MELTGRRALVTGASRGIGRELARAFARAGAEVALVARDASALAELASELGGSPHPCDLSDREAVAGLVERVEAEAGPIDVLVNNAGVSHVNYFLAQTPQQVDEIFQVNLLTPVSLCRQVVPRMLERAGGHLVNVSSLAGVIAPPGLVHYGASKAALSHYTAGLRQDLRGLPIGTTLVELGSVATELDDMSRAYGPLRELLERRDGKGRPRAPQLPVDRVAREIVTAIREDRRHVRLPRGMAPLAMLAEAPRRVAELMFRRVSPRG